MVDRRKLTSADGDAGLTDTPQSNPPVEDGTSTSTILQEKRPGGDDKALANAPQNDAPAECDTTSEKEKTSSGSSEAMRLEDATSQDALLDPSEKSSREKTSHIGFIWPTSGSNPAVNRMKTEAELDDEMQKLVSDFEDCVCPAYRG